MDFLYVFVSQSTKKSGSGWGWEDFKTEQQICRWTFAKWI